MQAYNYLTKINASKYAKLVFVLAFILISNLGFGETWYSYKNGAWSDNDSWTLDPGGTSLSGFHTPQNNNTYVILAGRTITLTANVIYTGLSVEVRDGAILNLSTFQFDNTLTSLSGQGIIKLNSTSILNATTNNFTNASGGTYEFNNTSNYTIPSGTYNNITFYHSLGTIEVLQTSNITLNGNLYLRRGKYIIGNATASKFELSIGGNLTVDAGSSIAIGTGNTFTTAVTGVSSDGFTAPFVPYYINNTHTVKIYGDFTNSGTVRFTNQTLPHFGAFPSQGAATVYFLGSTNNNLTCNGTTDFFNLVMDKGTDQTYSLSVSANQYYNFRLFGPNISGGEDGGDNPIIKKALWLKSGTMRLFGKIVIPSLSEGACDAGLDGGPNSDFYIPENAALVMEGPDVIVLTTADDYREVNAAYSIAATSNGQIGVNANADCSSFSVLGTFEINAGYLSTRESGGLIYWAASSAQFIVNGGTVDAKQFRTAGSSGGLTAFRQTGGTLSLRGRLTQTVTGVTTPVGLTSVPYSTTRSTGGLQDAVGTFNIDRDDNIFEMTGGTIEILDVCGQVTLGTKTYSRVFEVNSLPAYANVTGGNIIIKPTTGGGTNYDYDFVSSAPIYNLTVDRVSGTQPFVLTNIPATLPATPPSTTPKAGVTQRLNPPLVVLNNLTLTNNATLNASGYEVQVGGNLDIQTGTTYSTGNNLTTLNGSGAQTLTGGGTISSVTGTGFYKFKVDKSAGTLTLGGTPTNYTVRDSLKIDQGTINDGGKTIYVMGNIYVGGTHTGTGKIVMNGTITQTVESDVLSSNVGLGNIELYNNTNPGVQLLSDLTSQTLSLNASTTGGVNRSIFYLVDKRLTLTNGVVLSSGNQPFGINKMVRTDGSMSAKGLKVGISFIGAGSPDYLFPVGVGTGTTNDYNPFSILTPGNPGTTNGFLTVIPVNSYHPTVSNTTRVIQFYWTIQTSGFVGAVSSGFQYYFDYSGTITANQNKACFLDYSAAEGWDIGSGTVDRPNSTITFDTGLGFLSTDFTSGNNSAFNKPRLLYSRASDDWSLASTWSEVGFGGAQTATAPKTYDRFLIGGAAGVNHQVTITTGLTAIAGVEIYSTTRTGIAGTPPTLIKPNAVVGINVTYVSGGGRYQQWDATLPTGDFDALCTNDTATFEYAGGSYNIPSSITTYPNLHITSNVASVTKNLPDANILVRKSLRLISTNTESVLSLSGSTNTRTLTIYGDLEFQNTSTLNIPATTGTKTINVYGNINFRYNNTDHINNITAASGAGTSHKLNFYGSTITSGNSRLNFYNAGVSNQMDLYFLNPGDVTITNTTGATTNYTLNRIYVNKDALTDKVYFQNNFTLGAVTNTTAKALQLLKGTFYIDHPSTNILLSSSGVGSSNFTIPQTSALVLRNGSTVRVNGSGTGAGIFLDGLLRAESSTINVGDGTTTDNRFIEYSGSGNAAIELTGSATLIVNSQIRRSLSQTNGVLKYSQSGTSSATVFGQGVTASQYRAKLEITNSGSSFSMSDNSTLTIVRGGGTSFGDLYLRPTASSVTGGTINIGSDVGVQTFKFDIQSAVNNLNIVSPASANTAEIMVNPLQLNGSLNISSNSTLRTNGINVSIKGNFTNNGVYNYGSPGNTTTFNGVTQILDGSTATTFWNLIVSPSNKLSLVRDLTVFNNLNISSGTFEGTTYVINVKGNLTNSAVHTSTTGKISLNGNSALQYIGGNGTFGKLELDNPFGAFLNNNITLTSDFLLTQGIFNINQYLLTLGESSNIVGTGFGITKMIVPDGVISNVGIRKYFPSGDNDFEYPLGVTGTPNIYTPVVLQGNFTGSGSFFRIQPINERHPATLDVTRVLNYYWDTEAVVSGTFTGSALFYYNESDVTIPADEPNYVAARLLENPVDGWSKAAPGSGTDNVDETNNEITFTFSGTNNLGGQYTAGIDEFLPNIIPTYTSKLVADIGVATWDDINDWTPTAPTGGPNGFIVIIPNGSTVSTNGNRRFAYKTTLNGRLDVATTYGHNLGIVNGTGTLAQEFEVLPAGRFTNFFNCSGGTLELGGAGSYTMLADRIDTLRNLHFVGGGVKTLPNKDLVICNELLINGPNVNNASNRMLTIGGSMTRSNGSFTANNGTSANAIVRFKGTSPQTLSGFNTSTNSKLHNLKIDNPDGLTLQSQIDFDGNLILTNGVIHSSSANMLVMLNASGVTDTDPIGGSEISYIDGPLRRVITGGRDFIFPIGKLLRYGKLGLLTPQDGTWTAEYFNQAYSDLTVTTGLTAVSSSEHWRIIPSVNHTAKVQLRWDIESDINPNTTTGGINDIVIAEYNGTDWDDLSSTNRTGDANAGTLETTNAASIVSSGNPQFYTLGSTTSVKAMARFSSTSPICQGTSIPLTFSGLTTAQLPYKFVYTINGVDQPQITINNASELPYNLSTSGSSGTYKLKTFTYTSSNTAGLVGNDEIVVNPRPNVTLVPDVSVCGSGQVTLTAPPPLAGESYNWYSAPTVGTLLKAGSTTYTTPLLYSTTSYYVATYNTTTGCESTRDEARAIINPLPTFVLPSTPFTVCEEDPFTLTVSSITFVTDYDIEVREGIAQTLVHDSTGLIVSPYSHTFPNMVWAGPDASKVYSYYVTVTDANGCTNNPYPPVQVTVWKKPETGPQYHVPNSFGY